VALFLFGPRRVCSFFFFPSARNGASVVEVASL